MYSITEISFFLSFLLWGCYYGAKTSRALPETRVFMNKTIALWINAILSMVTIQILINAGFADLSWQYLLLAAVLGSLAGFGIGRSSYLIAKEE